MEELDLVVVGAGFNGLAVAKTYAEINPVAQIVIVEAASTVGGVWASHRLYPGLKTNNQLGSYEYSDFPMDSATFGVKPGQYIPGQVVHDYLQRYSEKFHVFEKIRFNSKVTTIERHGGSGHWLLTIQTRTPNGMISHSTIIAHKLVLATGLTSDPFMPDLRGAASFSGHIFHAKDFFKYAHTLHTKKNVVVYGGHKSAWDVSYAYAAAGVPVNMVIRSSGRGPNWMTHTRLTPFQKKLTELAHTRFFTWFSPCIWGDADGFGVIRRFLHGTRLGRYIVDTFWGYLGDDITRRTGYEEDTESVKLKPWTDPFWSAANIGILNYETDFFDFVRKGMIKIHIAEISFLSSHEVHLSNDETLRADTLVLCTGWKFTPPVTFHPPSLSSSLGLPSSSSSDPSFDEDQNLCAAADAEILTKFPRLANPPPTLQITFNSVDTATTIPWRLYRFMVPPSQIQNRDIAFAGAVLSLTVATSAEIQALWITAFFGNGARIPDHEEIERSTILHSRFGSWRCPAGNGAHYPDFVFDAVPYFDLLLGDLGVGRYRKRRGGVEGSGGWWRGKMWLGGWWREIFEAYGPRDYRGVVGEWMVGERKRR